MSLNILWSTIFYSASCSERNIRRKRPSDVSDETVLRLFFSPFRLAASEDICSGSRYSRWSFPLFFSVNRMSFETASESIIFIETFQHVRFRWMKIPGYARRYFLQNTFCCFLVKKALKPEGREVIKHTCIYTSTRFWLQEMLDGLSKDNDFLHMKHTVS